MTLGNWLNINNVTPYIYIYMSNVIFCISLHFIPSRQFIPSLQSAFYTDQIFYHQKDYLVYTSFNSEKS